MLVKRNITLLDTTIAKDAKSPASPASSPPWERPDHRALANRAASFETELAATSQLRS
jgi:hypothetical protein